MQEFKSGQSNPLVHAYLILYFHRTNFSDAIH